MFQTGRAASIVVIAWKISGRTGGGLIQNLFCSYACIRMCWADRLIWSSSDPLR